MLSPETTAMFAGMIEFGVPVHFVHVYRASCVVPTPFRLRVEQVVQLGLIA